MDKQIAVMSSVLVYIWSVCVSLETHFDNDLNESQNHIALTRQRLELSILGGPHFAGKLPNGLLHSFYVPTDVLAIHRFGLWSSANCLEAAPLQSVRELVAPDF